MRVSEKIKKQSRVIIYCYSENSFKRIAKAFERQNIKCKQEKHTIPRLEWVFLSDEIPFFRNYSDCKVISEITEMQ
jgi:hypothetical protein